MDDYYKELNRRYNAWDENYNHSPKIQINWRSIEFCRKLGGSSASFVDD
ncbi:hypothetical protein Q0F97_00980 [Tetragenococcus halophilus]